VDIRQDEADRYDNMVDVFGKTFLGLTVACARCHDHKFDAISTKDYYALYGFLESSSYRLARFDSLEQDRRIAPELPERRAKNRGAMPADVAARWRPTLARLADYLLGAGEVMRSAVEGHSATIQQTTKAKKLNADVLQEWCTLLQAAAKEPRSPWHAFA